MPARFRRLRTFLNILHVPPLLNGNIHKKVDDDDDFCEGRQKALVCLFDGQS